MIGFLPGQPTIGLPPYADRHGGRGSLSSRKEEISGIYMQLSFHLLTVSVYVMAQCVSHSFVCSVVFL
jgi:hypothetical protein